MKIICSIILLIGLVGAAKAAPARTTVLIEGNYVTLGDIFPDTPAKLADTQVLMAPEPGNSITLSQQWLTSIAQKYGIDYIPQTKHDSIKLTGASETVPVEDVEKILKDHLSQILKNESFTIRLDNKDLLLHFPKGKTGDILVTSADVNSQQTRFQATLVLQHEGKELNRSKVTGRIQRMTSVPVLARTIQRGETIQADDIQWQELPSHQINNSTILDEAGLIGASTNRQELLPNRPLNKHEVSIPHMVVRNQAVTIYAESPIINITAKGKALENGAKDSYVKVMNIDSQRVIHATVIGPQQVRVDIPGIHTVSGTE
jgi:flagellar basal body P-ring formation protein FlgA